MFHIESPDVIRKKFPIPDRKTIIALITSAEQSINPSSIEPSIRTSFFQSILNRLNKVEELNDKEIDLLKKEIKALYFQNKKNNNLFLAFRYLNDFASNIKKSSSEFVPASNYNKETNANQPLISFNQKQTVMPFEKKNSFVSIADKKEDPLLNEPYYEIDEYSYNLKLSRYLFLFDFKKNIAILEKKICLYIKKNHFNLYHYKEIQAILLKQKLKLHEAKESLKEERMDWFVNKDTFLLAGFNIILNDLKNYLLHVKELEKILNDFHENFKKPVSEIENKKSDKEETSPIKANSSSASVLLKETPKKQQPITSKPVDCKKNNNSNQMILAVTLGIMGIILLAASITLAVMTLTGSSLLSLIMAKISIHILVTALSLAGVITGSILGGAVLAEGTKMAADARRKSFITSSAQRLWNKQTSVTPTLPDTSQAVSTNKPLKK